MQLAVHFTFGSNGLKPHG